jgi:hypothetical protein
MNHSGQTSEFKKCMLLEEWRASQIQAKIRRVQEGYEAYTPVYTAGNGGEVKRL